MAVTETWIPLTRGQATVIDSSDLPIVGQYRWTAWRTSGGRTWYASTNTPRVSDNRGGLLMHRLLLPGAPEVDHRDGDGLNNRRANLRPATHKENSRNQRPQIGRSSRFKGVTLDRAAARHGYPSVWKAYIKVDGIQRVLGRFRTEEEAARAYDRAAVDLFGEFAATNESWKVYLADVRPLTESYPKGQP